MTKLIAETDWEKCLRDAKKHQSTRVTAEIDFLAKAPRFGIRSWATGDILSANPVSRAIQALIRSQTLSSS